MEKIDRKEQILRQAGYAYNFDREIYFNRRTKRAFSVEYVEDHTVEQLQSILRDETGGKEWRFYFNSPPPKAVETELKSVLG